MGFFKSTPEERLAANAAAQSDLDKLRQARRTAIDAADLERAGAWREMGAPEGIVVDRVYAADSSEDVFAAFAQYAGALGLQPEDTYGVQIESGDNYSYVPRAMVVIYRDRPEYAQGRSAFRSAHPDRTPHHIVIGVPTEEMPPSFTPGSVRKRINTKP